MGPVTNKNLSSPGIARTGDSKSGDRSFMDFSPNGGIALFSVKIQKEIIIRPLKDLTNRLTSGWIVVISFRELIIIIL